VLPVDPKKLHKKAKIQIFVTKAERTVTIPEETESGKPEGVEVEATEHTEIQALLLKLGKEMSFDTWVARNDKSKEFEGKLLGGFPGVRNVLPLQFDQATNKTIELIDVLWLKANSIVAAFEIESTTSVYSGLLRMADLIAMQPNINIPLYIVAPDKRREKVITEINRPTFSRLEPGLNEICRFLSFSTVEELFKKFGADVRRVQNNFIFDFFNNGSFTFGGAANGPEAGNTFTGDAAADFVAGFPGNFFQFSTASYNIRTTSQHYYAQDSFKIRPRLTLVLGLRYEYNSPQYDLHNNIIGFFGAGAQSTVFPNAPPGVLYPGDPGTPNRALVNADRNNFAPRFGFAWDIFGNAKLVMRGGAGIFYDIEDGALNLQFGGQPPFGDVSNLNPKPNEVASADAFADPFTPLGVTNPFPFASQGRTGQFFVPKISFAFVTDPHFRTPYSENFNFGLQYQLSKDMAVEAVYVGSLGRKLISTPEVNPPQPAVRKISRDQPGRHPGDPGAVLGGLDQRVDAVDPQPRGNPDLVFGFSVGEAPLAGPGRIGKHQAVVTGKFGGRAGNAEALQISRCRADDHLHIGELARHQLRIRQMPDVQRELHVFLDHVDGAVDQQQLDGNGWIAVQEIRQQRRDQQPPHQGRRRDADAPGRLLTARGQRRFHLLQLGEDRFRPFVKQASVVGQRQPTGCSQQEPRPEQLLQRGNLPTDRGQRAWKRPGRAGQAAGSIFAAASHTDMIYTTA